MDDLSGEPIPSSISVDLSRVSPKGEEVPITRRVGSFLILDVRGAFDDLPAQGEPVYLYWYVDWDLENQVAPIQEGPDTLQYFACQDEYDPPELSGAYPELRTLMVVATTVPLEDNTSAYLVADEGYAVAMVDWRIHFEGNGNCLGGTAP